MLLYKNFSNGSNFLHTKFEKGFNKIRKIKDYSLTNLPDRTKIFLSALWFWVYITFYLNKLIGCMLGFILTYTPDSCIIDYSKILKEKNNPNTNIPEIIDAKLGNESITNKLKMLVQSQWDNEISDLGGINVKDIVSKYPALSTSVIWVSYVFQLEKKLQTMSDEEIGKAVKYMLISITDKAIYKESTLENEEELIFGEIPF
jgi:hypothetical protein